MKSCPVRAADKNWRKLFEQVNGFKASDEKDAALFNDVCIPDTAFAIGIGKQQIPDGIRQYYGETFYEEAPRVIRWMRRVMLWIDIKATRIAVIASSLRVRRSGGRDTQ